MVKAFVFYLDIIAVFEHCLLNLSFPVIIIKFLKEIEMFSFLIHNVLCNIKGWRSCND